MIKHLPLRIAIASAMLGLVSAGVVGQTKVDQPKIADVEFEQRDIRAAVREVCRLYGQRYNLAPDVQGTVTVNLKKVRIDIALENVLRQVSAMYTVEGGIYEIYLGTRNKPLVETEDPKPGISLHSGEPLPQVTVAQDGRYIFVMTGKRLEKVRKSDMKVVLSIPLDRAGEPPPFSDFATEGQIDTLKRLGNDWSWQETLFHPSGPAVSRNLIPAKMSQNASEWVRKILRPEVVPTDLDSRWIGYRREQDADFLAATFGSQKNIVWLDGGTTMDFVIRGAGMPDRLEFTANGPEEAVANAVASTIRQFLQVPSGWAASVQFEKPREAFLSNEAGRWGPRIWYGIAKTMKDGAPTVNRNSKSRTGSWFDYFVYWTDGSTYDIEFPGLDQARPKWPQDPRAKSTWVLGEEGLK